MKKLSEWIHIGGSWMRITGNNPTLTHTRVALVDLVYPQTTQSLLRANGRVELINDEEASPERRSRQARFTLGGSGVWAVQRDMTELQTIWLHSPQLPLDEAKAWCDDMLMLLGWELPQVVPK